MKQKYKNLFQPINIGKLEIKNRIVMAPMATALTTQLGGFQQRMSDFLIERAKGGVGLIITTATKVENEIEESPMPSILPCITLNPVHFASVAGELTERVHAYGAKIFLQLSAGMGRNLWPNPGAGRPVAPSEVPNYFQPDVICRALETEEVENIVKKFGEATEIAVTAGFDGIDVHGHEGYLIDEFFTAMFNKRTDKYGGDLRGRMTFAIEILKEIKRVAGKDFPVTLRYSMKSYIKELGQGGLPGEDFKELGRDIDETIEAGRILEKAGYDGFDCDAGCYDAFYWAHPPVYQEYGCSLPLSEKLKKAVTAPVIVAGRLEVPDLAERALAEGKADMIALARGLLADADWPNKVMKGKIDKIRPCVSCHDGCSGRGLLGRPMSCAVNPACGREKEYAIEPAQKEKKVMIVGGGIAGMETARVAALRGHRVAIYEKSKELGGHLLEAAVPDFKEVYKQLLNWYKRELVDLTVKVNLGMEVGPGLVAEEKPDVVIAATGSKPIMMDVPGADKDKVTTATDLLLGNREAGQTIAVIGGGLVGCEMALWLAKQGTRVTIVEALDELMMAGHPIFPGNRLMLIDLLKHYNVKILTGTNLLRITDEGVIVRDESGAEDNLTVDTVAIAVGLEPDRELYRSLADTLSDLYVVGDANEAVNVMHAIWDAYEVARSI